MNHSLIALPLNHNLKSYQETKLVSEPTKTSKITEKEKSKMKNLGINNRYSQNHSYKL